MPINVDVITTEKNDNFTVEPIMVTISLQEYRCLIQENAINEERISYLENRLIEETNKNNRGVDND